MKSEHEIQNEIRIALSPYAIIYRANVGKVYVPGGRFFGTGLPKGFPDLFGFRKSDGKAVFIEVKRPDGRLSQEQEYAGALFSKFPVIYGVCHSVEDAVELIKNA